MAKYQWQSSDGFQRVRGDRTLRLGMATDAEAIIRREIAQGGAVTFARFMELALYAPGSGYYERTAAQTGRGGDFYTSVSVGPVLGFLLAGWMASASRAGGRMEWVEAAAHDGQLAADILEAVDRFFPELRSRLSYRILEPSEIRKGIQRRTLARWEERVSWSSGFEALTQRIRGVLFSNELLDAMPVHRLGWDARGHRWFEWGVTTEGDGLAWCRLEPEAGLIPAGWEPLTAVLPDGFVVETSPAARAWWRSASDRLERGWLVAFDYGFDEASVILPERTRGTARAYYQHRMVDDLLARPGEQDLTAHVDFPMLQREGEAAGLRTEAWTVQGRWLGRVAAEIFQGGGAAAEWLGAHARGLQTLTHPGHLGHVMRVLVQSRGEPPV